MKKITAKSSGVEVELTAEPEDQDPADQFDDPETIEFVREQISSGNEWGWCVAHVKVTYKDILSAEAYLGGCSYKSKKDFMKDGYYKDMVGECIDEINTKLAKLGR